MKTKTVNLYQFDELPAKLKQVVLDKHRTINVEDLYWYDYDGKTGFSAAEMDQFGIGKFQECDVLEYNHKEMTFDIEYAPFVQFRGCHWSNTELARTWLGISPETWGKGFFEFVHPSRENRNTAIEFQVYGDETWTDDDEKQIERAMDRFDAKMQEAARDLKNEYEHLQSDEAVAETLRINEYYFNESGEIDG